mgnify:CR=1 FL=1
MKTKTKQKSNIFQKILLYIWISIGTILSIWTAVWFIYTTEARKLGEVIIYVIFFAIGLKLLFVYAVISLLIFIIWLIIKGIKRWK